MYKNAMILIKDQNLKFQTENSRAWLKMEDGLSMNCIIVLLWMWLALIYLSAQLYLLWLFFFSVTSILVIFVNMFKKSRDENARTAELEKKKLEKDKEKATLSAKKVLEWYYCYTEVPSLRSRAMIQHQPWRRCQIVYCKREPASAFSGHAGL